MSLPQVVRRYARALYAAAREAGELPTVGDDMARLDEVFDRLPEAAVWCRGRHPVSMVPVFIREIFLPYLSVLTGRTLTAAAEYGRLSAIPWLSEAFRREAEAQGGLLRVRLESARRPEAALVETVRRRIVERTGRQVSVNVAVVPELRAGFRVSWSDRMVDLSVRGRLGALRSRLTSETEP